MICPYCKNENGFPLGNGFQCNYCNYKLINRNERSLENIKTSKENNK